jgi:hypothetical protein
MSLDEINILNSSSSSFLRLSAFEVLRHLMQKSFEIAIYLDNGITFCNLRNIHGSGTLHFLNDVQTQENQKESS